ncbi:hypothetical protein Tco_0351364 [Tanacetum coccineum]
MGDDVESLADVVGRGLWSRWRMMEVVLVSVVSALDWSKKQGHMPLISSKRRSHAGGSVLDSDGFHKLSLLRIRNNDHGHG